MPTGIRERQVSTGERPTPKEQSPKERQTKEVKKPKEKEVKRQVNTHTHPPQSTQPTHMTTNRTEHDSHKDTISNDRYKHDDHIGVSDKNTKDKEPISKSQNNTDKNTENISENRKEPEESDPTVLKRYCPPLNIHPLTQNFENPPNEKNSQNESSVSFSEQVSNSLMDLPTTEAPLVFSVQEKGSSEYFSLSKIKLNPKNPRLIRDNKFDKLCESLRRFPKMMALRPIIVNEEMIIIGGNMRYRALKEIGYKSVPREWVKFTKDLTPEEQRRFIVVDNVSFGEDDYEVLSTFWDKEELEEWGMDLPMWEDEEEKREAVEDNFKIPEVIKTDIKQGDVIEIGRHRLICGDSTKKEDMKLLMGVKLADLVFTDPPYGVDYKSNKLGKIMNDKFTGNALFEFIFDAMDNIREFCNKNIGYYVWYEDRHRIIIQEALEEARLELKSNLIWNKGMNLSGADYQKAHENCLYLQVKGEKARWYGERDKKTILGQRRRDLTKMKREQLLKMVLNMQEESSVWDYDRDRVQEYAHPTQKPVTLSGRAINNSSVPDDIVVDIFAGSGSTMVACHQLDRICYSIELDPKYCQVIIDRMKALDQSLQIKINGKLYGK